MTGVLRCRVRRDRATFPGMNHFFEHHIWEHLFHLEAMPLWLGFFFMASRARSRG